MCCREFLLARCAMTSIVVNGQVMPLAEGATVEQLLARLGVRLAGTAVELNRCVVPRSRHAATVLSAGDRVEIVTLVGGG